MIFDPRKFSAEKFASGSRQGIVTIGIVAIGIVLENVYLCIRIARSVKKVIRIWTVNIVPWTLLSRLTLWLCSQSCNVVTTLVRVIRVVQ